MARKFLRQLRRDAEAAARPEIGSPPDDCALVNSARISDNLGTSGSFSSVALWCNG
jgi:hypothetical protein